MTGRPSPPRRLDRAEAARLGDLFGVSPGPDALAKIDRYFELLARWNRAVPLVGRPSAEEAVERGFFEAFWASALLPRSAAAADVGSGAGFPGLAIKLFRPDLEITLIDSHLKKVLFLREAARAMELRVEALHLAGEDFAWETVAFAMMRGLKPSGRLLRRLEGAGVGLLLLHGRETVPELARFRIVESRLQPGSVQRRATLFAPPA